MHSGVVLAANDVATRDYYLFLTRSVDQLLPPPEEALCNITGKREMWRNNINGSELTYTLHRVQFGSFECLFEGVFSRERILPPYVSKVTASLQTIQVTFRKSNT